MRREVNFSFVSHVDTATTLTPRELAISDTVPWRDFMILRSFTLLSGFARLLVSVGVMG